MKNNTIDTFTGWADIVDYESDENSVTLINAKGEKVAEYGYSRFTREDFERFKTFALTQKNNDIGAKWAGILAEASKQQIPRNLFPDAYNIREEITGFIDAIKNGKRIGAIPRVFCGTCQRELMDAKDVCCGSQ